MSSKTRLRSDVSSSRAATGESAPDQVVAEETREPRRRRGWWGLTVVLVVAGVGSVWLATGNAATDEEGAAPAVVRFVEVVRTDLVEERSFDGNLG